MKQLYKKNPSQFAKYADTNIESVISEIQLEQALKNSNISNSKSAAGGGSNPPVVPGKAFENTLTGLVTNPKSIATTKINSNQQLDPNDLTNLSLVDLKDLKTNVDDRIEQTASNGDIKNQMISTNNALIINKAITTGSRIGQNGGSKNKTSKNRRQRFNIRLV